MSITRLQQARQMYALGQRVAKTMDGSRPGYRGSDWGGSDYGDPTSNTSGGNKSGGTHHNPHTESGYSKTSTSSSKKSWSPPSNIHSNDSNVPEAYEIIGGKKFDVTPETRQTRELARVKADIMKAPIPSMTSKGINYFKDGIQVGFAPNKKNQFGLFDLALIAASGGLFGPKLATGAKMFNTGKKVLDLANTIGLTDQIPIDIFTSPFKNFGKDKKSTTKSTTKNNTTNKGGDGEGLASLENQAGNYDEYILLLQKLQSGNISDSERNRYNILKSQLGI